MGFDTNRARNYKGSFFEPAPKCDTCRSDQFLCLFQQTLSKDKLEAFEQGTFKSKSKPSKKEQEEMRKKVRC